LTFLNPIKGDAIMANEGFKRKLTAILSADVAGYSRLMEDNDEETIQSLNAYRNSMSTLIQQHRGRVVDMTGDNLLAEFSSVVDAVKCAVETQKEMSARNAELPENRRMLFRIGVNLGDIVEEDDRIYGDGVNIAARLEALAEAGGICISRTAYGQVKNKLELGYEYLGEHDVKNISEPVHVYRVLMEPEAVGKVIGEKRKEKRRMIIAAVIILLIGVGGIAGWYLYTEQTKRIEPAAEEKMAFPLPEKPSIAVLPFDNMSGDPEQDYIADGFTENIITGLSQIPEMFVIARNSVFTYKGKSLKIKQISEELGVKYVLEGSLQKSGDKFRITTQLIDALAGHHLWSQRYDRNLEDLFAIQDDITMKISEALEIQLTRGEGVSGYRTSSFEAWSHFAKGRSRWNLMTKEDNLKAREHMEKAVNLDSAYADAWCMRAWTHFIEARMGWSESPADSIKQSVKLAQRSLALDDTQASCHQLIGHSYLMQKKYDKAITEGERAVALNPNRSGSHIALAMTFYYAGKPEDAIVHATKALRLEPYYPAWYLFYLAIPYEMVGRYEEAIATLGQILDRALKGEFPPIYVHERLAISYARLDKMDEARTHAEEILKIKPDYSVEFFRKTTPHKDQEYIDSCVDLLIKAGLPK
jgi:adenylate cyclase